MQEGLRDRRKRGLRIGLAFFELTMCGGLWERTRPLSLTDVRVKENNWESEKRREHDIFAEKGRFRIRIVDAKEPIRLLL